MIKKIVEQGFLNRFKIMKYQFVFLISTFLCIMLNAQYQVEFILKEQTAIKHDSIFIVGSFNGWDSLSNTDYLMHSLEYGDKTITLNLAPGTIEYKFHRGSWLTVEKEYYGAEVENRVVTITKDTSFIDSVVAWRDLMHIDKKIALGREKTNAGRVRLLADIARGYAFTTEFYNVDSAFFFAQEAIDLQQKILQSGEYDLSENPDYYIQLIRIKEIVASLLHALGNYPKALEIRLENFEIAEKIQDKFARIYSIINLADDFTSMKDFQSVLNYAKLGESLFSIQNNSDQAYPWMYFRLYLTIAEAYYNLNQLDSALLYANKTNIVLNEYDNPYYTIWNDQLLGDILAAKGDHEAAFSAYKQLIPNASRLYASQVIARAHTGMSRLLQKENQIDSALHYARKALNYYQNNEIEVQSWGENSNSFIAEVSPLIAELYQSKGQLDSAYKYLNLSVKLKDDLYNADKVRQFQTLTFNEAARRQELEQQARQAKEAFQTKVKIYGLITLLIGILALAIILYWNNKRKQKVNATLHQQKQEIESTLEELKTTQAQLIQSEKMASLGELTAGIAHEIQNPLNFVNNFSEVSGELIDELSQEIEEGNASDAKEIITDLKQNLEKINHHGERASSIVKGMLDHSRTTSGEKVLTDINQICDEYLRLAYHGMRAKHKSFKAYFETDFAKNLAKINIIPQDIGRVILNIINNAFQACTERSRSAVADKQINESTNNQSTGLVKVSTEQLDNSIRILISDNGPGIPDHIKDKIFQPFFTTKPTGQGTGLGLSLSYDIVKAHGGKLEVFTKPGQGSEFKIILPIN